MYVKFMLGFKMTVSLEQFLSTEVGTIYFRVCLHMIPKEFNILLLGKKGW